MSRRLVELALALTVGVCLYAGWHHLPRHTDPATATDQRDAPLPPALAHIAATTPGASPTVTLANVGPTGLGGADLEAMRAIEAHFATGDFVGAARLADQALDDTKTSDAFHTWLRAQMPVLLTSAGWARLKLGDCEEATTYLRRSEALKRAPETAKGLAVCYYKLKNLGAARDQFAFYLDKQSDDAQMELLYTDVLESDGRYDEAVHILEQLVAAPPEGVPPDALKQRLDGMRGKAHEGTLQQVETSHNFRLAYRAGDHEDLVAFVLQTLEDALDEYMETYGFRAPPAPLEVALYPAADFRSIIVGGPQWAEGLFDGRLRIPIKPEVINSGNYTELTIVLRHELVHALLSLMDDSRTLPPWFDEGMAQRLSCAGQPCGQFQFDPQPGGFLAKNSFETPYLSLSALSAGRAYRQSLFLVMTLETIGTSDSNLRQIVSSLSTTSNLSSDGLLKPVGLNFQLLQDRATYYWQHRSLPVALNR